MKTSSKYSLEVKERAVRMMLEHHMNTDRSGQRSQRIGRQTLCLWVRQAERDQGQRSGLTTEKRERKQPFLRVGGSYVMLLQC